MKVAVTFKVAAALLLTGCVSIPRDSGFSDVRQSVIATTRQPIAWDPSRPVQPPDDAAIASMLDRELTADRAVEIAFANNRDLLATLETLGIARADYIAATTIRNPIFDAEIRFPGNPSRPYEMVLSQTLLDILQFRTRRQLGRAQFEAARVRTSAAIINFAAEVRTNYYDLLAARKLLARAETIMKTQEAATEIARRQHEAGNISDLDLENQQALYEQEKLDFARAQLDELQARELLTADLGLMNRTDLKLPQEFPPFAATDPTPADVDQQAMNSRFDIRAAQQQLEAARRGLPLARVAVFDDLAVGGHREREPEGLTTTGPSIAVPIPIFNRAAAQRTRTIAVFREAQQRLAALTINARSEARAASERLVEAKSRMTYLRDVVIPRRTRILLLTQQEYNAMVRGVFQLIQARRDLTEAERGQILAVRDYWVARTDLETALLGTARFSVRNERPLMQRIELFRPMSQQQTKTNE